MAVVFQEPVCAFHQIRTVTVKFFIESFQSGNSICSGFISKVFETGANNQYAVLARFSYFIQNVLRQSYNVIIFHNAQEKNSSICGFSVTEQIPTPYKVRIISSIANRTTSHYATITCVFVSSWRCRSAIFTMFRHFQGFEVRRLASNVVFLEFTPFSNSLWVSGVVKVIIRVIHDINILGLFVNDVYPVIRS